MKEFFVIVNGQQQGPFTIEQLAEMAITPETEVWTSGMDDWKQAGDVAELTSLLQQMQFQNHMGHSGATPPPYVAPLTNEPVQEAAPKPAEDYSQWDKTTTAPSAGSSPTQSAPEKQKKNSGCGIKFLLGLLILVILGGVLAVTCPARQDHKDAISQSSREWIGDKIQSVDEWGMPSIVTGAIEWISGQGVDFAIDQYLDVDNYGVCSVGHFKIGDESKLVSIGVLNHVFTFDAADVDRFLLKALKEKVGIDDKPSVKQSEPTISEDPADEEDSYLATPSDEDSVLEEKRSSNPAEELLDSLAVKAKREAIKTAKEWAKKQIDRMGNGN